MYLQSIDGLHTAVKQTDYYKGKGTKKRRVLIDRANWLINAIHSRNQHLYLSEYKPVPLHRDILRKMLGRHEAEPVINLLQEIGIITVDQSYTTTTYANKLTKQGIKAKPESKKYGLTDLAKTMTITEVGILTEDMERKMREYRIGTIQHYLKDTDVHRKIIYNLTALKFNPQHSKALKALQEVDQDTEKGKYYHNTYQALQRINDFKYISQYANFNQFYYYQSNTVKRVFHYYSSIPKQYRACLTHRDGTPLVEIDLKNAQPLIIALNYYYGKTSHTSSDKKLLQDVVSGNFYEEIANQALKHNDTELYNLYTRNYSKFKPEILGKGLYYHLLPLDSIKAPEKYLLELYPEFIKHLREKKHSNGYKTVSIEAQQIESSIFIDGLFKDLKNTEFAVPVHDSILVRTGQVNHFLNKLICIFSRKFPLLPPNQVRDLFKVA